jgi:hypothetical protein
MEKFYVQNVKKTPSTTSRDIFPQLDYKRDLMKAFLKYELIICAFFFVYVKIFLLKILKESQDNNPSLCYVIFVFHKYLVQKQSVSVFLNLNYQVFEGNQIFGMRYRRIGLIHRSYDK